MCRQSHRLVDRLKHVWLDEFSLAEDPNTSAVSVEEVAVLGELSELDLRHVHQGVDFIFGAFEVLDAEGIDGNMRYPRFVAYLEDLNAVDQALAS
jgi:hypothetical protein